MTPLGPGSPPLVARAHPFTPLTVVAATLLLAYLLPAPRGPVALAVGLAVLAAATGAAGAVRRALLLCALPWGFLVVLHGVLDGGQGWGVALAQGARLFGIATASFALLAAFDAARFTEATAARGWPGWVAYLVAGTLQAVPRLAARAATVREAQRVRGLRASAGLVGRARATLPLAGPLALAALAEVDERAMTLELRGLGAGRRTPLAPPPDRPLDRAVRWLCVGAVAAAAAWRWHG